MDGWIDAIAAEYAKKGAENKLFKEMNIYAAMNTGRKIKKEMPRRMNKKNPTQRIFIKSVNKER